MRLLVPINGNAPYTALCKQYADRLGYIIGPSYYQRPRFGIPFALDNDAFRYFKNGQAFNLTPWLEMLTRISKLKLDPLWVVVPDVVGNAKATLDNWYKFNHIPYELGFRRAFVLQDGMTLGMVPLADVYFVGGSTQFKWSTAHVWCKHLHHVHVGRVRTRRLPYCEKIGAESCDGSGWLRDTTKGRAFRKLEAWLERCNHQYEFAL